MVQKLRAIGINCTDNDSGHGAGDREKRRERRVRGGGLPPAEHEPAFGGRSVQRSKRHFGREVLGFRRRHERGAESRTDESDPIDAGPDFLRDARSDSRAGTRRENAIVETRIVRSRKQHEGGGGEFAEPQCFSVVLSEGMRGGKEDAVALPQEQARAQAGHRRVRVQETTRQVARLR